MMNDRSITTCKIVFTCLCLVNFVNCLSSREARMLNIKFELLRNGIDNKLVSAMVEIDDIRDSVRNCSCHEPNVTVTEQTQTFDERTTNGTSIRDEKQVKRKFEKKEVQIIEDQIRLQVNCGWTDWATWEQCSVTCGIGLSLRKRECTNPYPGPRGNPCIGEYTDVTICMLRECLDVVHGGWTDWAPWEQCSVTCGIGLSLRERECSNPYPGLHGNACVGEYTDAKMCMIKECIQLDVNGGWSDWTRWGQCSKTCGTGIIKRERYCSNPYPGPYGNPCIGDYMDVDICMLQECQNIVHGGWTGWESWGECSQTCGTGLVKRSRKCSNPYPGPLGNHCFGDSTDTKLCLLQDCIKVVHDSWTYWARWEQCSHTCGTGLRRRKRRCTNTKSGSSENSCSGDQTDVEICMLRDCPSVDGGWNAWTSWDACTSTCNGGLMARGRKCNNPKPSSHGTYCDGPNRDSKLCNTNKCPDPIVYFTMYNPKQSMVNDVVVFQKAKARSGNDNSGSTGKFTCTIPGLYHFYVKYISHLKSGSDTFTQCFIMKNNNNYTLAYAYNSAFGKSGIGHNRRSASGSAYVSLVTGDTVYVGRCKGWDNIGKQGFDFIGALITTA